MNFRLTDLRNFNVLASSRTMREAAVRLEISPPALSESISRLESDLGGRLFYRSRSGVTLTPFGRKLEEKAKHALTSLESVEHLAAKSGVESSRQITIGCHPVVGAYFLPHALRLLQRTDPGFQMRLRHGLSRDIQVEIQQGRVDVGIVVNAIASPDLVIRKFTTDKVGVWMRPGAEKDKIFCNLALNQTQSILNKWTNAPGNRVDSDSLDLIARLASAGLGYAILPERMVRLVAPDLVLVKNTPVFNDVFSLVHRPEFARGEFEKRVIEVLKSSVTGAVLA